MIELEKKFSVEQITGSESEHQLVYGETGLLSFDEPSEVEVMQKLAVSLNNIMLEKEMEIYSLSMMLEFFQKVIGDTVSDKLDNIDNLYAMKKMMGEICENLEKLGTRLANLKKDGDGE